MLKKSILILNLIIFLLSTGLIQAQSREYMFKAGFLEKFARFTDWPNNTNMDDKTTPFKICIIGENPFKNILAKMYKKQKIKNKRVEIFYISKIEDIKECHLLFITKEQEKNLLNILLTIKEKPILTVGDTNGYANKGVHINLYITNKGTIHFEINEKKVKESGLRINLMLLEVAKIIKN